MKSLNHLILVFSFCLMSFALSATTIVPFPNLGEMAKASEAVVYVQVVKNFERVEGQTTRFRTQLKVLDIVKGQLEIGELFEVQSYRLRIGDMERAVWGDLEMEDGASYFLFLDYNNNGYWQPKMLSYAAFQEEENSGENLLVPFGLGAEVHIHNSGNGLPAEPLSTYKRDDLIAHLKDVLNGTMIWNKGAVESKQSIKKILSGSVRNPTNPAHCTNLSGTPFARWNNFETTDLPIRYSSGGDAGCSNEVDQITNAVNALSTSYGGINISLAGTHGFVPTCSGEGATDSEFTTWVSTNLGGGRNLLIQFDDPCSEITDLSGCNGTLAIGGLYWFSSTHTNCGVTFRNAAYGYVIVNNGTGACQCPGTDYEIMITHEITHSLNIGHIATGDGVANMNPSCCNSIQTLDQECLEFLYPLPALPVELVDFTIEKQADKINLQWETVNESANDFFTIERSIDGIHFDKIGQVEGKGDSQLSQNYSFEDFDLKFGTVYYRLSQTDLDGTFEILGVQSTFLEVKEMEVRVQPNPIKNHMLNIDLTSPTTDKIRVEVIGFDRKRMINEQIEILEGSNSIGYDSSDWSPGVYFLRIIHQGEIITKRFVVAD